MTGLAPAPYPDRWLSYLQRLPPVSASACDREGSAYAAVDVITKNGVHDRVAYEIN